MQIYHFLVRQHPSFDILGSVRIFERIYCFLILSGDRSHIRDHYGLAIPTERVLEQTGKLGVSVWYVGAFLILIAERVYTIGEG